MLKFDSDENISKRKEDRGVNDFLNMENVQIGGMARIETRYKEMIPRSKQVKV